MSAEARSIARRVEESATEFGRIDDFNRAMRKPEVYALDKEACEKASALIRKLDTEVFRLRQAIGCYLDGRLGRSELRNISSTWNEEPHP